MLRGTFQSVQAPRDAGGANIGHDVGAAHLEADIGDGVREALEEGRLELRDEGPQARARAADDDAERAEDRRLDRRREAVADHADERARDLDDEGAQRVAGGGRGGVGEARRGGLARVGRCALEEAREVDVDDGLEATREAEPAQRRACCGYRTAKRLQGATRS
jgi:hypothetical protein